MKLTKRIKRLEQSTYTPEPYKLAIIDTDGTVKVDEVTYPNEAAIQHMKYFRVEIVTPEHLDPIEL